MEKAEFDISDLATLPEVAKKLLEFSKNVKVFAFEAPMGAGKTTFIKELCKVLGSKDNFSSPTYSIVNEYAGSNGKLYHFDLYRIRSQEELYDMGFEEYVSSGNYCFIEWPSIAQGLIGETYITVEIVPDHNIRRMLVTKHL